MINAQLPDGTTLQFPDGTADGVIDQAVQGHLQGTSQAPPQHPVAGPTDDLSVDVPRRLASAGTDALGMLLSTPRALASGVDWLGNKVGLNIGADPALASVQQPGGEQLFPDPATAHEMAFQTTGATEYQPSTTAGRVVQAGLSAAPLGLASGIKAVVPSLIGGGIGELGAELLPDHPLLGRILGFMFGAHATSTVANAASRSVANATGIGGPTTEAGQAYQRQGITPTTSVEDATGAWQKAAENAAVKLGPGATPQETGAALQSAVNQWKSDWQANTTNKWNTFRQEVPADAPIQVGGFQKALQDVNQNFGGADALAKELQPGLSSNLQTALAKDITPNGTLPWQAVQATRTRLGQLMQSADPDIAATAKRLYGGLSDDMRAGATAAGPQAEQAFNDAAQYTWAGHKLLDDHLNPIIRATNPEQAAQYALQQTRLGGSRLNAIDIAAPGQVQNLGAGIIRQAADISPQALQTRLNALSPEAKAQLFGGPGGAQQDVNDLVTVAQKQREIQQAASPPRFASDAGRFVTAMEAGRIGHELAGTPGRVAGAIGGYAAAPVLPYLERQIAANRLLSATYGPRVTPFAAPGPINTLLQSQIEGQPR